MNIEDLLRRATAGQVAPSELDDVAQALARKDTPEHRYQLLMVIGKSGAYRYRQLVERWLRADDDPMMVRLALKILCDYWGETERYLPFVLDFMRGAPWDTDDDVRLVALSTAGEYLSRHEDRRLLALLLRAFESEEEVQIVREAAYCALARAAGKPWKDVPSAAKHFDLHRDTDPAIISAAKRRLAK